MCQTRVRDTVLLGAFSAQVAMIQNAIASIPSPYESSFTMLRSEFGKVIPGYSCMTLNKVYANGCVEECVMRCTQISIGAVSRTQPKRAAPRHSQISSNYLDEESECRERM